MTKIKLFLASSSELKADREQFEIFIRRENKKRHDEGIFLDLEIWEDFIDAMSPTQGCSVLLIIFGIVVIFPPIHPVFIQIFGGSSHAKELFV